MNRRNTRRPLTCYHEAGHAVASWHLGRDFERIVVLTPQQHRDGDWPIDQHGRQIEYEGHVDQTDIGPASFESPAMFALEILPLKRSAAKLDLVVSLAGPYAEAHYRKCSAAAALILGGDGDMSRYNHMLTTWFSDTDRDAIAKAAIRQVKHIPRVGWPAITAVAKAVMECGVLHFDAADALCVAAYGHLQPKFTAGADW